MTRRPHCKRHNLEIASTLHFFRTMGDTDGQLIHPVQDDTIGVEDLLRNCHALLHELEAFRTFLVERKKQHTVEIRQFRNSVQSELKSLEKVRSLTTHPPFRQQ